MHRDGSYVKTIKNRSDSLFSPERLLCDEVYINADTRRTPVRPDGPASNVFCPCCPGDTDGIHTVSRYIAGTATVDWKYCGEPATLQILFAEQILATLERLRTCQTIAYLKITVKINDLPKYKVL